MTDSEIDGMLDSIIRRHVTERHPGQNCCEDPESGECYALVVDGLRAEMVKGLTNTNDVSTAMKESR